MTDVIISANKDSSKRFWHGLLLCVLTTAVILFFSYQYISVEACVRNSVISLALCGLVVMGFEININKHKMLFSQNISSGLFVFIFLLGVCLLPILMFINTTCFPYIFFALALMMCSNEIEGMSAYFCMIIFAYLLGVVNETYLIVYLLAGVTTIILFQGIGQQYRYKTPLICSILLMIVYETAVVVISKGNKTVFEDFVYPFINAFVNLICMVFFLKYFSFCVIHKNYDKLKELTQTEYPLMNELKTYSVKEYHHALHMAYFCDKLAAKLDVNTYLLKAGGYYLRIGKMADGNFVDNIKKIAKEHHFPKELTDLITECSLPKNKIHSKEAAILVLCDAVITSISYIFEKDNNARPDYEQIVGIVLKKKIDSGILDECYLTMSDYAVIKKIFVEEKVYYDFLR